VWHVVAGVGAAATAPCTCSCVDGGATRGAGWHSVERGLVLYFLCVCVFLLFLGVCHNTRLL